MPNSRDQIEYAPIAELKQLKLEEKLGTTMTTIEMDIISSLPDSLLCHILSFLPTRSSVATSILSRRWRHLWKDVPVLDLIDEFLVEPFYEFDPQREPEDAEDYFVDFVETVIPQVRHIQKFRLSCDILYYRDTLRDWINAIIGPHLEELYLKLCCHKDNYLGEYSLPLGIFTCTSLVSLTLQRDILLDDLPSIHLPSLKYLKLDLVFVTLDRFLSGCPSLETLEVLLHLGWHYKEHGPQAFHMPHSLKSLTFRDDYGVDTTIQHLEIDTPSLEYLDITLYASCLGVSVCNFPNMLEAHLDIHPKDEHIGWVPKVLKALCKTRLLVLKYRSVECLLRAPALHIPEFCRLRRLQIDFSCFNSRFLLDLLHNCHRLNVLIIRSCNFVTKSPEPTSWTQAIKVPNCVISHLHNIEFSGYRDFADEHEFTAYILQRGLVLRTMTIHTDTYSCFDQEKKDHILKELSIVPRGSSICQLKLD